MKMIKKVKLSCPIAGVLASWSQNLRSILIALGLSATMLGISSSMLGLSVTMLAPAIARAETTTPKLQGQLDPKPSGCGCKQKFSSLNTVIPSKFQWQTTGYQIEQKSQQPLLLLIQKFIKQTEAQQLIELAKPMLERSKVVATIGTELDSSRTSSTAFLDDKLAPDLLVPIRLRAANFLGVSLEQVESLQVVHYTKNQEYKAHWDYFHGDSVKNNPDLQNQRLATFFVYLNDLEEQQGGGTHFPELDIYVKPQLGVAAFWFDADDAGQGEPKTLHAGTPVLHGEKWGLNIWVRHRPRTAPILNATTDLTQVKAAKLGQYNFNTVLALDSAAQARGLMFRKNFNPANSMLFVWKQPAAIKMWMKNTYLSLDMLFLNDQRQILCVHENTVPQSLIEYTCPNVQNIKAVLELNAGMVQRTGVKVGEIINFYSY